VLPASALEIACRLEAGRRRFGDLNRKNPPNQVDLDKQAIRVNVLNQPNSGFSYLWLSQDAVKTWPAPTTTRASWRAWRPPANHPWRGSPRQTG
jgi:hypothetical protein